MSDLEYLRAGGVIDLSPEGQPGLVRALARAFVQGNEIVVEEENTIEDRYEQRFPLTEEGWQEAQGSIGNV